MSKLPQIKTPTYQITLPSNGQKIAIRPFLVADEKAMMVAAQTENIDNVIETIKTIMTDCTMGKVDVAKIPYFDFEWIYMQLRSKSANNIVELQMPCRNPECNEKVSFSVDLDKFELMMSETHSKKIILADDIGMVMKYPNIDTAIKLRKVMETGNIKGAFDELYLFVECVFRGDEIIDDFTKEEFNEWLDMFKSSDLAPINQFFDTMPVLRQSIETVCKKCGHKETIVIEGMQHFLA